jgi:dTMP kinase
VSLRQVGRGDAPPGVPPGGVRGRLVALEGVDGAGKSTLARLAAACLGTPRVRLVQLKRIPTDAHPAVQRSMRQLAGILWPPRQSRFERLLPPEYWLHLQVAWYALLSEFVVEPGLAAPANLLSDGWHYKFVGKLLMRGFPLEHLLTLFSRVASPDRVVLLDVDVERVWSRKEFRLHEMGLHDGYARLDRDSFLDYQGRLRTVLLDLAGQLGWDVLPLDADAPPRANARAVAAHLVAAGLLREAPGAGPGGG